MYPAPTPVESLALHVASVHVEMIRASPEHAAPPLLGAGSLHWRVRAAVPWPHVTEQVDVPDHWPQFPFTTPTHKISNRLCWLIYKFFSVTYGLFVSLNTESLSYV